MRKLLHTTSVAILAMAFPIAALAQLTGTTTLTANTALNLDTGATASSGGDVLWSGTSMTPQSNASVFNIGPLGAAGFGFLDQSTLSVFPFSKTPIPASSLVADDVFAVKTNGNHVAAVLVTAVSGTSLTVQYKTFGVTGTNPGGGPTITLIMNNFGLIPPGFPNAGIAPGALFIVRGTGLADPAAQAVLQSSSGAGLPTTLNGASVKVTVNGTTVTPAIYYAIGTQLAVVLPSNTPVGTGTVTVTFNGQTSNAFPITVVQSAMGFDSYYGTGSGLGVATDNNTGALYDYAHSIPPGTAVVLWGSGLGADAARDTKFLAAAFPINGLSHVYVGGIEATILYQGASGYPGVNQVNIVIPNSAPTGCNVSLAGVNASGVPTNFTTLPIGNGPCSDPAFGVSGTQFQNLSSQQTVKVGSVGLIHSTGPSGTGSGTTVSDIATASFQSFSGSIFGANSSSVSVGSCIVNENLGTGGNTGTINGLNAGTITVSGPGGGPITLQSLPTTVGLYFAQLAAGFIPSTGGTFNFHGTAGSQVGAFDTSVDFPNPLLNWTNQAAASTINRSAGQLITWTGGAPGTQVIMNGGSSATVNGQSVSGSFTCIAPVSAGQFTVPNYVLGAMPAGNGSLSVSNSTNYKTFTATGIDFGTAYGFVTFSINATYN